MDNSEDKKPIAVITDTNNLAVNNENVVSTEEATEIVYTGAEVESIKQQYQAVIVRYQEKIKELDRRDKLHDQLILKLNETLNENMNALGLQEVMKGNMDNKTFAKKMITIIKDFVFNSESLGQQLKGVTEKFKECEELYKNLYGETFSGKLLSSKKENDGE